MEGIIDHRADGHAVAPAEMYIKHGSNKKVRILSGKMVIQAGSACQTSKNATLLRLLNMLLPKYCLIPLLLYGGTRMSFKSAPELLPL
jgi:hypothetical protein